MKIFTIEQDTHNITVHATAGEADAVAKAERLRNQAGLGKLAAGLRGTSPGYDENDSPNCCNRKR
ncbi:MAG: hypothetical protein WBW33_18235 [Bryobacteraceae bacterium]